MGGMACNKYADGSYIPAFLDAPPKTVLNAPLPTAQSEPPQSAAIEADADDQGSTSPREATTQPSVSTLRASLLEAGRANAGAIKRYLDEKDRQFFRDTIHSPDWASVDYHILDIYLEDEGDTLGPGDLTVPKDQPISKTNPAGGFVTYKVLRFYKSKLPKPARDPNDCWVKEGCGIPFGFQYDGVQWHLDRSYGGVESPAAR